MGFRIEGIKRDTGERVSVDIDQAVTGEDAKRYAKHHRIDISSITHINASADHRTASISKPRHHQRRRITEDEIPGYDAIVMLSLFVTIIGWIQIVAAILMLAIMFILMLSGETSNTTMDTTMNIIYISVCLISGIMEIGWGMVISGFRDMLINSWHTRQNTQG